MQVDYLVVLVAVTAGNKHLSLKRYRKIWSVSTGHIFVSKPWLVLILWGMIIQSYNNYLNKL